MTNPALDLFNDRLPNKPYFSDDLHFGVRIAGKERAILAKYIQFNQPHAMFWLGFDVDRIGAAIDWSDRNAPAPTMTITNPENGHAHLLYALKNSIRTAPDGKMKPLKYAAAVENALRKKLDADVGYAGLICKNPNHGHWKIAVWQPELYTLDWLADSLDLNAAIRQGWPEYEQWLEACYERANAYNLQFTSPLDEKEVGGIAKSIAKWTHHQLSPEGFAEYVSRTHAPSIQAVRGRKSRGGGRPKDSSALVNTKPWLSLGISRATFYRKQGG